MKVYLHLADGFEEVEAVSVIDILRRGDIDIQTVSVSGRKVVVGAHGIGVTADILFEEADYSSAGMIVLPGGSTGTENMYNHSGLKEQISSFSAQGKWIAAICAAPSILGRMGLLKGKSALCYPDSGLEKTLSDAVIDRKQKVVADGKIITSCGPGTSFDFALKIVEVLKGLNTAESIKRDMLIG